MKAKREQVHEKLLVIKLFSIDYVRDLLTANSLKLLLPFVYYRSGYFLQYIIIYYCYRIFPCLRRSEVRPLVSARQKQSEWFLPKGQEQEYPDSGNTFTVTFEKPGMHNYICILYPWMAGSVLVK